MPKKLNIIFIVGVVIFTIIGYLLNGCNDPNYRCKDTSSTWPDTIFVYEIFSSSQVMTAERIYYDWTCTYAKMGYRLLSFEPMHQPNAPTRNQQENQFMLTFVRVDSL